MVVLSDENNTVTLQKPERTKGLRHPLSALHKALTTGK